MSEAPAPRTKPAEARFNRLIRARDFKDPAIVSAMQEACGRNQFPQHRKYWEYGMVLYALRELGFLSRERNAVAIGCGIEVLPYALSNYIGHVHRTDFLPKENPWSAEYAERIRAKDGPAFLPPGTSYDAARISFTEMDATRMRPFADASVDIVYSVSAIEHFGARKKRTPHGAIACMKESARILKPGGICLGTTEYQLNNEPHHQWFRREEFEKEIVQSHGMRPVEPFDYTLTPSLKHSGNYLAYNLQEALGDAIMYQKSILGVVLGKNTVVSICYAFIKE